jgi:hypothetical protein
MIYEGFWMILAASSLVAIGQPYLINIASKIATVWFSEDEVNYYFIYII